MVLGILFSFCFYFLCKFVFDVQIKGNFNANTSNSLNQFMHIPFAGRTCDIE